MARPTLPETRAAKSNCPDPSLALVGALVSIPSASAEGQRSDLLDSDNLVSWVPIRIFQPTKSFRALRMRGMDGAYASELTATPETE